MSREPVTIAGATVALLTSITKALVLLDIVSWNVEQLAAIDLIITNGAILGGVIFARGLVTPVNDPKDHSGLPMEVRPQPLEE